MNAQKSQECPMSWLRPLQLNLYRSAKQCFEGKSWTRRRTCSKNMRMPNDEEQGERRVRENRTNGLVDGEKPAARHRRAAGFSLIELLVVIGVIGVLMTLLFPALQRGKYSAQASVCMNQMRQIGPAIDMYAQDWSDYIPSPSNYWYNGSMLAGYLSQRPVVGLGYDILRCPVAPSAQLWTLMFNSSSEQGGYPAKTTQWKSPSKLLMIIDGKVQRFWTDNPAYYDPATGRVCYYHFLGSNLLFLDGHVQWFSYNYILSHWSELTPAN